MKMFAWCLMLSGLLRAQVNLNVVTHYGYSGDTGKNFKNISDTTTMGKLREIVGEDIFPPLTEPEFEAHRTLADYPNCIAGQEFHVVVSNSIQRELLFNLRVFCRMCQIVAQAASDKIVDVCMRCRKPKQR